MSRFITPPCSRSMHVAFGRKAFGCRCELDFVRAPSDDAIARTNTGSDADQVAIARGDLDRPPNEPLAADLDEHVRTARLHQDGALRHSRHALPLALEQDGRSRLPHQQLSTRIVDFELNR